MMKVVYLIQGLINKNKHILFNCFLGYRTFHPVERSDDIVVFDHDENNVDVNIIIIELFE